MSLMMPVLDQLMLSMLGYGSAAHCLVQGQCVRIIRAFVYEATEHMLLIFSVNGWEKGINNP